MVTIIWHPYRKRKGRLEGYAEQVDKGGKVLFHSTAQCGLAAKISTREDRKRKAVLKCLPKEVNLMKQPPRYLHTDAVATTGCKATVSNYY